MNNNIYFSTVQTEAFYMIEDICVFPLQGKAEFSWIYYSNFQKWVYGGHIVRKENNGVLHCKAANMTGRPMISF